MVVPLPGLTDSHDEPPVEAVKLNDAEPLAVIERLCGMAAAPPAWPLKLNEAGTAPSVGCDETLTVTGIVTEEVDAPVRLMTILPFSVPAPEIAAVFSDTVTGPGVVPEPPEIVTNVGADPSV